MNKSPINEMEDLPVTGTVVFFNPTELHSFAAAWAMWEKEPTWEFVGINYKDFESLWPATEQVDGVWLGDALYFVGITPPPSVLGQMLRLVHAAGKTLYAFDNSHSGVASLSHHAEAGTPGLYASFQFTLPVSSEVWHHFHAPDTSALIAYIETPENAEKMALAFAEFGPTFAEFSELNDDMAADAMLRGGA